MVNRGVFPYTDVPDISGKKRLHFFLARYGYKGGKGNYIGVGCQENSRVTHSHSYRW